MYEYIFQLSALLSAYILFLYYETHSYLRERLIIRTALPKEGAGGNVVPP